MREIQIRGEMVRRTDQQRRATDRREIQVFGDRHRELCPQDFLSQEALRCFEKTNRKMQ